MDERCYPGAVDSLLLSCVARDVARLRRFNDDPGGACVPIDGEIQTDDDGDEFPWFIVGIIGAVVGVTVGGVLCVVVVFVLRKRFRGDGDAVSRRRTGPVELDVDEENSVLPGESVLDEDSEL